MEVLSSRSLLEEVLEASLAPHDADGQTRTRLLELCRLETKDAIIQMGPYNCKDLTPSIVQDHLIRFLQRNIDGHHRMSLKDFDLYFEEELKLRLQIEETRDVVEQVLSNVVPVVESALNQVRLLRVADVNELRSIHRPPRLVAFTFEAVCILLRVKPIKRASETNVGRSFDDYWETTRRFLLSDPGQFFRSVESFDKDDLSSATIRRLRPYVESPEFTTEILSRYSPVVGALCGWVVAMNTYAVAYEGLDFTRHKLISLLADLEACKRLQPWYQPLDDGTGPPNSTTWNTSNVALLKAQEMLVLKLRCLNTRSVSGPTITETADLGQTIHENRRALATLEAWAGDAASVQAARFAACMIDSQTHDELDNPRPIPLSPAQMNLCAAMWVPSYPYALEEREHFASLAMLLPSAAPHVTVALNRCKYRSEVIIGLGPDSCGEPFSAIWKDALLEWGKSGLDRFQARWHIRARMASDCSVFDEEEADVASELWTSQEIDMKSSFFSPTLYWSYSFADVPAGVVKACHSVRFGTQFAWSGWSGNSDESYVLLPPPEPQGRLIVVTISDSAATVQWSHFLSPERLTKIQYRVVAHLTHEVESFTSNKADKRDVVTTVDVDSTTKQGLASSVELRVTGLSPSSSYMFSVDARYLQMNMSRWSSSLLTDAVVCTRHQFPASFLVLIHLMGGDPLELEVAACDDVAVLKRLLLKSLCIPVRCQRIHSSSLALADHHILGDHLDGDALALNLFVAASVDDVCSLLEEAANDVFGKLDEDAVGVLSFALKGDDCGLAVVRLYRAMSRRHRKQFLGMMKDLVDVVLSGRPLTHELESSLRSFDRSFDEFRSSDKVVLVEYVFIAFAMRGDELALEAVKPFFFHENSDVRQQALAAVMSSADERIRTDLVDRYLLMLQSKGCIRDGIPGLENLAALVTQNRKSLLVALRNYILMSSNSPTRICALQTMARLDATGEDTLAATYCCLEEHNIELVIAAISVPVLTIHELETITIGNHWPFVKRAAAQAILDRATRFVSEIRTRQVYNTCSITMYPC